MTTPTKIIWIFILFLALRIYFIFTFPPFIDESNYIYEGERAISLPGKLFEPVTLWKKQPLPFWLFGAGAFMFKNPIIGARLINFVISIPVFFILYRLVTNLSGKKSAVLALIFYTFCPIFIFFQSTALIDQMLFSINLVIIWLLFTQKKPNFKNYILTGLLLGISFWVKNSSLFMITITLFSIVFLYKFKPFLLVLIPLLTVIIPLIIKPGFYRIFSINQYFTLTIPEIAGFPIYIWLQNFFYLLFVLLIYLTPGVLIGSFFIFKLLKTKNILLLCIWFLSSVFSLILSLKFSEMRYYLFAAAPLLPLLAIGTDYFLTHHKKNAIIIQSFVFVPLILGGILLTFYPPLFFSLFPKESLIKNERDYAFSWPSGYGLKEALNYFELTKPANTPVVLALPDDRGNGASSYISAYYQKNSTSTVKLSSIPLTEKDFSDFHLQAKYSPIYLISSNRKVPKGAYRFIRLAKIFNKPGNEDFIGVYKFN